MTTPWLGQCVGCPYGRGSVEGEGPTEPVLLILGEAPGETEVREGRPFRGSAGKNLDELLAKVPVARDQLWVTNVVKCRPFRTANGEVPSHQVGNVHPSSAAIEACASRLDREIEAVGPHAILAMGAVPAIRLYRRRVALGEVHGDEGCYFVANREVPFVATYHPSPLSVNRVRGRRDAILTDLKFALRLGSAVDRRPSAATGRHQPRDGQP